MGDFSIGDSLDEGFPERDFVTSEFLTWGILSMGQSGNLGIIFNRETMDLRYESHYDVFQSIIM